METATEDIKKKKVKNTEKGKKKKTTKKSTNKKKNDEKKENTKRHSRKIKKETNQDIKVQLPPDTMQKVREENAIFVNETQLNEKMINQCYKFYSRRIKKFDFYSLLFCGAVVIITGINFLLKGREYFFGLIFNIIFNSLLILLGIYLWSYALKYKKFDREESLRIYNEDVSTYINYYYFNKDTIKIHNKEGTTERRYEDLESIYETKKYYYILISRNNGYIMDKNSFKKGTEEEFNQFIRIKLNRNYKKCCHRKRNKRSKK